MVSEQDPDAVMRNALRAARDLTGARYAALGLLDEHLNGLEHFMSDGMDRQTVEAIGANPKGLGLLRRVIDDPRPLMVDDIGEYPDSVGFPPNHPTMKSFLGVPVEIHGTLWGSLYLADKADGPFDQSDEESVVILAGWIAIAIRNARSQAAEKVQLSFRATEQERRKWARELHDDSLQNLASLRVLLSSARRRMDSDLMAEEMKTAIGRVDEIIEEMRRLIADLRPAPLDQLGLEPALTALMERFEKDGNITIDLTYELPNGKRRDAHRLVPELEDTIYRVVQESLNNAIRHGEARRAIVEILEEEGEIKVRVSDDGLGFDPEAPRLGNGLTGMNERIALAGGELEVNSGPSGSTITARVPARRLGETD